MLRVEFRKGQSKRTVGVTRTIDVGIVTICGFVFDVGRVNGDTTGLFFGSLVDLGVVRELG